MAEKISDLLIANGYSEESARSIESATKESSKRIDMLPAQSVVLAVGALDAMGDYRIKQIAIFEGAEYVITIAAKDDGTYDEAAEPLIPPGLLEDSGGTADAAIQYTLADGIYSAGLRNGAPEAVIREAIQLIQRLLDLSSPLQADETIRLLFETDPRDKAKSTGRVVYVGLRGAAITVDCYSFQGSDGFFRCFDPKAGSESKNGRAPPPVPSLGNSGATSVGGISRLFTARQSPRFLECDSIRFSIFCVCTPASILAPRLAPRFARRRTARSNSQGSHPASAIMSESSMQASRRRIPTCRRSPIRSNRALR